MEATLMYCPLWLLSGEGILSKYGLMNGGTVGTGTFSTLRFFALAIGDFKLGRHLCNLSLKLMKVNALKDKICMAFIFIKGLLNPWLYDTIFAIVFLI